MKLSAILGLALLVLLRTFSLCEADDYSDKLIVKANQGDIGAQRKLGFMYSTGHMVPMNYSEAMKWYKKADDSRSADAQLSVETMNNKDQGAPQK